MEFNTILFFEPFSKRYWGTKQLEKKLIWNQFDQISFLLRGYLTWLFFDDLCKHCQLFLILSRQYFFGSSTLSVWFRKHAAHAANDSHVCLICLKHKQEGTENALTRFLRASKALCQNKILLGTKISRHWILCHN